MASSRSRFVFVAALLVAGCATKSTIHSTPATQPTAPASAFPQPNETQRQQLDELERLSRNPPARANLGWVVDMGEVALPKLSELAADQALTPDVRDGLLVILGNSARMLNLREHPDARNATLAKPILLGLADPFPPVRRSAAYAARFVSDPQLAPSLRGLLAEKDFIQEQAVLALGTNGSDQDVVPIIQRFLQTDSGPFRYSCLYALATMELLHDVDVADVIRANKSALPAECDANIESVANRFVKFKQFCDLVRQLRVGDEAASLQAHTELQRLTDHRVAFNPKGSDAARARTIDAWETYLLKDYWLAPPPAQR